MTAVGVRLHSVCGGRLFLRDAKPEPCKPFSADLLAAIGQAVGARARIGS